MVKYNCECCLFITSDKWKYNKHILTNKHRINKDKSLPIVMDKVKPDEDKDQIIISLRQEVAYLKGKLEVYEKLEKKEEEEKYEGGDEDCLTIFTKYRDTFDLNLKDEGTIERLAEMRAGDDEVGEVTADNVFESFISNEINFLNHLDVVRDFAEGDDEAIGNFLSNVLKECNIDITERYKGRFKMFYDGEWLNHQESREKYDDFKTDVYIYFQNCYRAMKFYFAYNHKERELGDYEMIKPLLNKIINRFREVNFIGEDEHRKYIINKVFS